MLDKNHFDSPWQPMSLSPVFPYIALLLWTIPLLLFSSGNNSLMAHDEGLYAWRARRMFESGDWIHPWENAHHKTPGFYWLIATCYRIFGINEISVRFPSMILGIFSILLLYEIGKLLLGNKIGWLAAVIFTVEFLWLQYCRLGTPDVTMIFLILLAILSLIQAELNFKYRYIWGLIVGISFGLGFLVRSFMIFLPMIALFPYLFRENTRHRHLLNPMLYLGFIIGLIPTFIWLWQSFLHYGNDSISELFNFVYRLSSNQRQGNGILFYFWNVPIKSFPWSCLAILGLILTIRRPLTPHRLILVGFPITLFFELTIFSTRLSHYSLSLYPFIALLAAVGLDWLGKKITGKTKSKLLGNISYLFSILGIVLLLAAIIAIGNDEIRKYTTIALVTGLAWLILPIVWILRYHWNKNFITSDDWIAGWLIPPWLALAVAGSSGLIGDYNPEVKALFTQPEIQHILQNNQVQFVDVGGKTGVLLNFYTPKLGKHVNTVAELSTNSYAWISSQQGANLSTPYRLLGKVKNYQLIQLLSKRRKRV
ncbi:MAG: glycosyltransferase family 39 protein [Nostocaceae cyanobacterium]|nr:glycosyltransferase family 39 protein [Nostocaceae cyanobacterium]